MSLKSTVIGIPESKSILDFFKEKGVLASIVMLLCVIIALFHIVTSGTGTLESLQHRSTHVFAMLAIILLVSSLKKPGKRYLALNIGLVLLTFACWLYVFINSQQISLRLGSPTQLDLTIGTITILLVLEGTRRTVGPALSIIALLFLIYTGLGPWMPGILRHALFSFEEIINVQFLDMNGLWSVPVATMSTFIIIFLIMVGLLIETGMLSVFVDLAAKLVGRATGGAAKASVMASCFIGSLTGSAAADTLIVGSMMVPPMRKVGYSDKFAGGIQAAASSFAQFMPPVMGASAFIIAAFLGIPYITVCKSAAIPALMCFFSFFMIAHFVAQRDRLRVLSKEEVKAVSWGSILKRLYLLIPIGMVVVLLVRGWSPMYAGFIAVLSTIALSFTRKDTRFTLVKFCSGLERGIRSAFTVAMACAAAGLVVGAVMQSGLGFMLSASLVSISHGYLFILLPLVLVVSILLGFGMTTVGVYIIVSCLVAPAVIELGAVPLAAHLFPFYFGVISAITPPVAVAAYAVCGLTGASPWSTGVTALKLSIPCLCVPFIFVTQPGLLLMGSPIDIAFTLITTAIGVGLFAAAIAGYLIRSLKVYERIVVGVVAITFFFPMSSWWVNLIGLAIAGVSFLVLKKTGGLKREEN